VPLRYERERLQQAVVALDLDQAARGDDESALSVGRLDVHGGHGVGDAGDQGVALCGLGAAAADGRAVVGGVGVGDGDEGVEPRDGRVLVGAHMLAVHGMGEVFLADAQIAVAAVCREIVVDLGAGRDDDVGVGLAQILLDAHIAEVCGDAPLQMVGALGEAVAGLAEAGVVAVVAALGPAQFQQVGHLDPRVEGESGVADRTAETDDLDRVAVGEGTGEIHRGADRSADSVGIVQQKGDFHLACSLTGAARRCCPEKWGIRNAPYRQYSPYAI
jgi:hypothetical protein